MSCFSSSTRCRVSFSYDLTREKRNVIQSAGAGLLMETSCQQNSPRFQPSQRRRNDVSQVC